MKFQIYWFCSVMFSSSKGAALFKLYRPISVRGKLVCNGRFSSSCLPFSVRNKMVLAETPQGVNYKIYLVISNHKKILRSGVFILVKGISTVIH